MDLKETSILGTEISNHWYYRSKAKAMIRLLADRPPSIILDVGAGSGFFARKILSDSSAKEAWCVDIGYGEDSDTFEQEKPIYFRRSVDMLKADVVLLMDILEHLDDDIGLLRDYMLKVPYGARFLISVPAFQFLWSGHDVFLEHRRRYRLNQIEDVVRQAGLTVKHSCYYFGAVFPIAASIRLVRKWLHIGNQQPRSQLSRHSALVNGILAAMSNTELPFLTHNRMVGLTAFCVAEKL